MADTRYDKSASREGARHVRAGDAMSTDDDFYREILDDLYDGVYFVDTDRRVTYWNRGADRLMCVSKTARGNRAAVEG